MILKKMITGDESIVFQKAGCLDLCLPAQNCLRNANVRYIGELIQMAYKDLRALKTRGRPTIANINEALPDVGLAWHDNKRLGIWGVHFLPPED